MCVVTIGKPRCSVLWVHELVQAHPRVNDAESFSRVILTIGLACPDSPGQVAVIHRGQVLKLEDLSSTVLRPDHPLTALTNSTPVRQMIHTNGSVDLRLGLPGRALNITGLLPLHLTTEPHGPPEGPALNSVPLCTGHTACEDFVLLTMSDIPRGNWIARFCFVTPAGIANLSDGTRIFQLRGPGRILPDVEATLDQEPALTKNEWIRPVLRQGLQPPYDVAMAGEPGPYKYVVFHQSKAEPDWSIVLPWFNPTQEADNVRQVYFLTYTPESNEFSIDVGALATVPAPTLPRALSWEEIRKAYDAD